jgi:hypothetical protein
MEEDNCYHYNVEKKAIVVQVTGAAGAQRAKFDRLQTFQL